MKKKNNSGFTLVELIIVVALLAIMMGAILKLMDPIRSVYKDTYDTVNTKTVGETLISYVEDRVRYSTNVLVLENYVGVPQITPMAGKSSAKVGTSKYEYTNVIVVDNTNIRGSMFSDYKGDTGTSYARKNCKGCIYELKSIGDKTVLDLTSASAGTIGEDIYGDYDHDITMNTYDEGGLAYLSVDVLSTPKKYDGSGYVRDDENNFKAQRSFDLVNINISEKKVNRTNDRYALDKCTDFDTDPNYTDFPQQTTVPSGLTAKQQKYFDTSDPTNKYTYIFFYINRSSDSEMCTVNCMYDPNDPSPSYAGHPVPNTSFSVQAGSTLNSAAIAKLNNLDARSGYKSYYITDGQNKITDFSTYIINDDITFIVFYEQDENAVMHTAKEYILPNGSILKDAEGHNVTSQFNNGFAVEYLPEPVGQYDPATQYYEWYVSGLTPKVKATDYVVTTTPPSPTAKAPSKEVSYYCEVKNMMKVTFQDANGNNFIEPYYVKNPGEVRVPTDIPTKPSSTGAYVFDGWYCGGQTLNSYLSLMTGDTTFTPKFTFHATPPAPASEISVMSIDSETQSWGTPVAVGKIKFRNTGTNKANKNSKTITLTFNGSIGNINYIQFNNTSGFSMTKSGTSLSFKLPEDMEVGQEVYLNFQIYSGDESKSDFNVASATVS